MSFHQQLALRKSVRRDVNVKVKKGGINAVRKENGTLGCGPSHFLTTPTATNVYSHVLNRPSRTPPGEVMVRAAHV